MSRSKLITILLSIFTAICLVGLIIVIFSFVGIMQIIYHPKGLEGFALIAVAPLLLVSVAVTAGLSLINVICMIVAYKKEKIHPIFYKVDLIINILFILLSVGTVLFLILR